MLDLKSQQNHKGLHLRSQLLDFKSQQKHKGLDLKCQMLDLKLGASLQSIKRRYIIVNTFWDLVFSHYNTLT